MKTMATTSMAGALKAARLASRVENPPVAIVVMAWAAASKKLMPASQ